MDSHETSNIENVAKDFSKATKNLINVELGGWEMTQKEDGGGR